jgi:hypothetical protein
MLNTVIVLLLSFGLTVKIDQVRDCSHSLFLAGILFECYFVFFLLRAMTLVGLAFVVK